MKTGAGRRSTSDVLPLWLVELEAGLCSQPGVAYAVVLPDENYEPSRDSVTGAEMVPITAFFSTVPTGVELGSAEMHAYAKAHFPIDDVPMRFVNLTGLRLTADDALDRAMLQRGQASHSKVRRDGRPEDEMIIADLWGELLQVSRPEPHDDFFAIGGHSLLAMRLIALVKRDLGLRVPVRVLYDNPRLDEFCAAVAAVFARQRERLGGGAE